MALIKIEKLVQVRIIINEKSLDKILPNKNISKKVNNVIKDFYYIYKNSTIKELIESVIQSTNKKFEMEKIDYRFDNFDYWNYYLRPYERNYYNDKTNCRFLILF